MFLPRERKIHIFEPTCNVLFILWRLNIQQKQKAGIVMSLNDTTLTKVTYGKYATWVPNEVAYGIYKWYTRTVQYDSIIVISVIIIHVHCSYFFLTRYFLHHSVLSVSINFICCHLNGYFPLHRVLEVRLEAFPSLLLKCYKASF